MILLCNSRPDTFQISSSVSDISAAHSTQHITTRGTGSDAQSVSSGSIRLALSHCMPTLRSAAPAAPRPCHHPLHSKRTSHTACSSPAATSSGPLAPTSCVRCTHSPSKRAVEQPASHPPSNPAAPPHTPATSCTRRLSSDPFLVGWSAAKNTPSCRRPLSDVRHRSGVWGWPDTSAAYSEVWYSRVSLRGR